MVEQGGAEDERWGVRSAEPDAARYVLAAGWLAHATWDVVHHRLGRVVPHWYAETCLVADLTIATALLTVGYL